MAHVKVFYEEVGNTLTVWFRNLRPNMWPKKPGTKSF